MKLKFWTDFINNPTKTSNSNKRERERERERERGGLTGFKISQMLSVGFDRERGREERERKQK